MATNIKRKLYIASRNLHKIEELKKLIGENWDVSSAYDVDPQLDWEETGKTFASNALIKALAVREKMPSACILADDSGICIEDLNGRPGIYSARYAGEQSSDRENREKVLSELSKIKKPTLKAYFVCSLVFLDEKNEKYYFEEELHGSICLEEKGKDGFGYDSIFIPIGSDKTLAELSAAEKNNISHRKKALNSCFEKITT